MTPQQIDLVQASFAKVVPIADTAATLFYARLFETLPEVEGMFPKDMAEQRKKLVAALGVVVSSLKNLETILPTVQKLAARHVDYGVAAAHYKPVGEALVWTLQQGLGDAFTDETQDAWVSAYGLLSGTMIAHAYGEAAA